MNCRGSRLKLAFATFAILFAEPIVAQPLDQRVLNTEVLPKLTAKLGTREGSSAARDLAYLGPLAKPALPEIIRQLSSADPRLKYELLTAAAQIGGDPQLLLPVYIRHLRDPDLGVKNSAVDGIFHLGSAGKPGLPHILELLKEEKEPGNIVLWSAGKMGANAKEVLPYIVPVLHGNGYFLPKLFDAGLSIDPDDPRIFKALSAVLASNSANENCGTAMAVARHPRSPERMVTLLTRTPALSTGYCAASLRRLLRKRGHTLPDAAAKTKPRIDGLHFTLSSSKRTFMIGEAIPVTLRFNKIGGGRMFAEHITYDRSGRMFHLGFEVRDSYGHRAPDPVRVQPGSMAGGLRGIQEITKDAPFEQTVDLNEWALLDHPGTYQATSSPSMIHLGEENGPLAPTESNPLGLVLISPTSSFITETLNKARSEMRSHLYETRANAQHRLRFLLDDRAIPDMIAALDDSHGNVRIEARYGLGAYSTAPVHNALLAAVERGLPRTSDAIWFYAYLLAQADSGVADDDTEDGARLYQREFTKWKLVIEALQARKLKKNNLPPRETIEAISEGVLTVDDPGACEKALDHAASFDDDFLFQNGHFVRQCNASRLIPRLYKVARNKELRGGQVRDYAYETLWELGEKSAAQDVFDDLASDSPTLSREAFRVAAKADPIRTGNLLLGQVESKGDNGGFDFARLLRNLDVPVDPKRAEAVGMRLSGWAALELAGAMTKRAPEEATRVVEHVLSNTPGQNLDSGLKTLAQVPPRYSGRVIRRYLSDPKYCAVAAEAIAFGTMHPDTGPGLKVYVPDLLDAFAAAHSVDSTIKTARALQAITGIPAERPNGPSPADRKAWTKAWRNWSPPNTPQENKPRRILQRR